jgi:hypothetical protein
MEKNKSGTKGKKVFVSFDAPDDIFLKEAVIGQTKNRSTPFTARDKSIQKAQPQSKWEKMAEQKIKNSDLVVVMLGKQTHKAEGVKKEIELARKHKVPVVQVKPKGSDVKRVEDAGRLHNWTHENMEKLLKNKK